MRTRVTKLLQHGVTSAVRRGGTWHRRAIEWKKHRREKGYTWGSVSISVSSGASSVPPTGKMHRHSLDIPMRLFSCFFYWMWEKPPILLIKYKVAKMQIQALRLDPERDAVGRHGDSKVPITDIHLQSIPPLFSVDPWQDGKAFLPVRERCLLTMARGSVSENE